jgi:hypothetical protein
MTPKVLQQDRKVTDRCAVRVIVMASFALVEYGNAKAPYRLPSKINILRATYN